MIAILDYGLGNIKAFANIYKSLNIPHAVVSDARALERATHVILPGVGAFDHAMQRLKASRLMDALNESVLGRRTPVLGVCVGMQMLADKSEEGSEPGLGWIPGSVDRVTLPAGAALQLPHMGWNTVDTRKGEALFADLDQALGFYFLHSYRYAPVDPSAASAWVNYGGSFACAVRNEYIYGVQFHPEKSHHNGVRLLRNFSRI